MPFYQRTSFLACLSYDFIVYIARNNYCLKLLRKANDIKTNINAHTLNQLPDKL